MSNFLSPSLRVAQHLSDSAMLEGAHATVVLLAVKCLKRPRSEQQRSLMADWLSKLEQLRHPHVVRYHLNSLESDEANITVIMEAWGVSVSSLIASKEHCGPKYIAGFAGQVLRALTGLHSVGVVHGDIKPANVLLSRNVYKVCDIDEAATGSACYMSPARARRHPRPSCEDCYGDSYALGMCVLEVLTGRQPYCEFDSQCVVFARVCAGQQPRSWSARSRLGYDPGSERLIAALLASDASPDACPDACELACPAARASPSELLALVQLLCATSELSAE